MILMQTPDAVPMHYARLHSKTRSATSNIRRLIFENGGPMTSKEIMERLNMTEKRFRSVKQAWRTARRVMTDLEADSLFPTSASCVNGGTRSRSLTMKELHTESRYTHALGTKRESILNALAEQKKDELTAQATKVRQARIKHRETIKARHESPVGTVADVNLDQMKSMIENPDLDLHHLVFNLNGTPVTLHAHDGSLHMTWERKA
jgi:predicted Zn-ribbon and HTH transcriptional regulator